MALSPNMFPIEIAEYRKITKIRPAPLRRKRDTLKILVARCRFCENNTGSKNFKNAF